MLYACHCSQYRPKEGVMRIIHQWRRTVGGGIWPLCLWCEPRSRTDSSGRRSGPSDLFQPDLASLYELVMQHTRRPSAGHESGSPASMGVLTNPGWFSLPGRAVKHGAKSSLSCSLAVATGEREASRSRSPGQRCPRQEMAATPSARLDPENQPRLFLAAWCWLFADETQHGTHTAQLQFGPSLPE